MHSIHSHRSRTNITFLLILNDEIIVVLDYGANIFLQIGLYELLTNGIKKMEHF